MAGWSMTSAVLSEKLITVTTQVVDSPVEAGDATVRFGSSSGFTLDVVGEVPIDDVGPIASGSFTLTISQGIWDQIPDFNVPIGEWAYSDNGSAPASLQYTQEGGAPVNQIRDESGGGAGELSSGTITITLPDKPGASISTASQTIIEGDSIDFAGSGANGYPVYTFFWDFDGGATNSTDQNPSAVQFDTVGTYNVTFTVTDQGSETANDSITVTVNAFVPAPSPPAPVRKKPTKLRTLRQKLNTKLELLAEMNPGQTFDLPHWRMREILRAKTNREKDELLKMHGLSLSSLPYSRKALDL